MGLITHGRTHRKGSISSVGSRPSTEAERPDTTADDETVVDADQGNVLSHIISQLRPGADLSRVTLPTFILEPRSMLERITNFMSHPETLLPLPQIEDPVDRFVAVTKFYLSGWHIKPPGVKKPLNPILGETFTGYWDYPDGTRGYYISEQTSHHPPKSSYFFMAPEHQIRIDGTLKPRSKFLGNSVGSFMEGIAVMRFTNRNERYFVTQPNMYARGILFGKMKYELGDHAVVRCPESGLEADIEFKVKGWMGGTYNAIGGFIKETKTGKNLFELSGLWTGEMSIKNLTTGKKEVLFDATNARPSPIQARPISEQTDRESQNLWHKVTDAIKVADQRTATDEKSFIEDRQRKETAEIGGEANWVPRLFRKTNPGHGGPGDEPDEENLDWVITANIDGRSPAEAVKQILAIAPIVPGQQPSFSTPAPHQPSAQAPSTPTPHQPSVQAPSVQQTYNAPQETTSHNASTVPVPQPQAFQALKDFDNEPQHKQQSPLDDMSNLKQTVPIAHPAPPVVLQRQDSVDGQHEEFVDAES